jgi:uncharacterized protein (TIGR02466 family)
MTAAFWFATPIYSGDLSPDELALVSDELDSALGAAADSFHAVGRESGLLSTFRHEGSNNFIAEYRLQHLARQILKHAEQFCRDLGIDRYESMKIEKSWVSIIAPAGFQFAHSHSPSMVSGIYYHRTSSTGGSVIFESPNVYFNIYDFPNNGNQCRKDVEYTPQVGRLLLFPSWLTHFVDVNRTQDERVSLSFDLKLRRAASAPG